MGADRLVVIAGRARSVFHRWLIAVCRALGARRKRGFRGERSGLLDGGLVGVDVGLMHEIAVGCFAGRRTMA